MFTPIILQNVDEQNIFCQKLLDALPETKLYINLETSFSLIFYLSIWNRQGFEHSFMHNRPVRVMTSRFPKSNQLVDINFRRRIRNNFTCITAKVYLNLYWLFYPCIARQMRSLRKFCQSESVASILLRTVFCACNSARSISHHL